MKKLLLSLATFALVLCGCSSTDTSKTAQNGDIVIIDFVGKIDGVEFENGSASNQALFLGSGSYIDGFEEGMVDMAIGETKTIEVTFPEEYTEELAGKDATFDITMNGIYKENTDESYACQNGDVIIIDFVGKIDGVEFENGSASNQALFLGAGGYIDGFEAGIVGMKLGETKVIEVTFPEDYTEELAGVDATFDITLNAVYTSIQ